MSAPPTLRLRGVSQLGRAHPALHTRAGIMRRVIAVFLGLTLGLGSAAWWLAITADPMAQNLAIITLATALIAAAGIIRWPELEKLP